MILQQRLRDACEKFQSARFRNKYSGRGMNGQQCIGIVGTHTECTAIIAEVISESRNKLMTVQLGSSAAEQTQLFHQIVNTLLNYRQDDMGLDVILYWPIMHPIPEPTEEDLDEWAGQVARGHK